MSIFSRIKGTFFIPVVILAVGLVLFVFAKLYIQRNIVYSNIDLRLQSAAKTADLIVNDSMIEAAQQKVPLDLIQHDSLRNLANEIASIHECVYVYVMIKSGDSALFVLSSYIESDITNNMVTNYLDYYQEATPTMMNAFDGKQSEVFDYSNDVWGNFRSIYVYRETAKGTPYLLCADVKVSEVFDFQLNYLVEFAFSALFLIIIFIPMVLRVRKQIIQKNL